VARLRGGGEGEGRSSGSELLRHASAEVWAELFIRVTVI
jgi:hypothetical protein